MALVLARLKLALQLGQARGSMGGTLMFGLMWALGIVFGLGGGFLVAALDSRGGAIGDVFVLLLFFAFFGGWIVLPIATPVPMGNIIDPVVLEQYPLSSAQQVGGLLLGGLISPMAAVTFLTAAGGVAQTNADLAGRVVAVIGAALFTVMCVSASYAVRALFADALTTRRGRDVAVILSTLVIVGMYVLPHVLSGLVGAAEQIAAVLDVVLTWTPPGAAGALGYVLADGDVVGTLARIGVLVATIALALLLWAVALRRHVKGHSARSTAGHAHAVAGDLALVPWLLHRARNGVALGAASQHLRYYFFRSPRAAQFVVLGPVLGIIFASTQVQTAGLPFAAAVASVAVTGGTTLNLFGFDGRGVETTLQTGASLSAVLRGKLLAVGLFLVPTVAALVIGVGFATGMPGEIPLALVTALAALLLAAAVGAASSATNPYDQEAPKGDRGELAVRMLGAFAATFAVVYGVGWFCTWAQPVVPSVVVIGIGLVLAAVAAVVSLRASGAYLDRHPARLLAAFTPR